MIADVMGSHLLVVFGTAAWRRCLRHCIRRLVARDGIENRLGWLKLRLSEERDGGEAKSESCRSENIGESHA